MKVAFGLKAHSGWAALVVLGQQPHDVVVIDRRRIELVKEEWAKQPYHAAEDLKPRAASDLVKRGIADAQRIAVREMRAAVQRERDRENEVTGCAVLVGKPMGIWSNEEILAVHFRMHKVGVLFRDALVHAGKECGLRVVEIPEKLMMDHAGSRLPIPLSLLLKTIADLEKSVGPPWVEIRKMLPWPR
jgi:hypothetical protein